jgi:hypothetical protein
LGIEGKTYQRVAIVNLDVEKSKHGETEKSGNPGASAVADWISIEGRYILIFLTQAPELQPLRAHVDRAYVLRL